MKGVLELYLLVGEGSNGVVEEGGAYAVLWSDEEQRHVGIDDHCFWCSVETYHLQTVGSLDVEFAVQSRRCGVVVGLQRPCVGKRSVELCPCRKGHEEHTYPEQSFHPVLYNDVNGRFIVWP